MVDFFKDLIKAHSEENNNNNLSDNKRIGALAWLTFISEYNGPAGLVHAMKNLENKLNAKIAGIKVDWTKMDSFRQEIRDVVTGVSLGLKKLNKGIEDIKEEKTRLKTDEDLIAWIVLYGMKYASMRSLLEVPDGIYDELRKVWVALDQAVCGKLMPGWVIDIVDIVADELEVNLNKLQGRSISDNDSN